MDCDESNSLLKVFREVKDSAGMVDLALATGTFPASTSHAIGGVKHVDLGFKWMGNSPCPEMTEAMITGQCPTIEMPDHPQSKQAKDSQTQTPEEIFEEATWPVDESTLVSSNLAKKRKHIGLSRHKFLIMKLSRMQQRFKELEKVLQETESLDKVQVTSTKTAAPAEEIQETKKFICPEEGCSTEICTNY